LFYLPPPPKELNFLYNVFIIFLPLHTRETPYLSRLAGGRAFPSKATTE
jgi:hypothetical protein